MCVSTKRFEANALNYNIKVYCLQENKIVVTCFSFIVEGGSSEGVSPGG